MNAEQRAALFSYLAYAPPNANKVDVPEGWVQVEAYDRDDATTGFGVRVFLNTATGEYVVAYRGSAAFAWGEPDWLPTNLDLYNGFQDHQAEQALELVAHLQDDGIELANVTFTGHSLGGGLAAMMAVFFGRPAITFAAAPFEASVRDDIKYFFQHDVADYYAYYHAYLQGLDGPPPSSSFLFYRDAWESSSSQGEALYESREQLVRDWYVSFDPVRIAEAIDYPWHLSIAGSRTELEVVCRATFLRDVRMR